MIVVMARGLVFRGFWSGGSGLYSMIDMNIVIDKENAITMAAIDELSMKSIIPEAFAR